jgi:hypothetical protein
MARMYPEPIADTTTSHTERLLYDTLCKQLPASTSPYRGRDTN